jgi:hypothetical protein
MKEAEHVTVIIVSGLPGSGKSYFAKRLAADLNAVYLSSDEIRSTLQARGKYTLEDKMHVYKHMAHLTALHLESNETVVVDATFYHHAMRDLFADLASNHHCPIAFILITTSEQLYHRRLSEPRKDSEADLGVYESMKALFEPYTNDHLEIYSGTDNITQMITAATDYLHSQNG